ncbi:unnamed protein product [Amoebophrya sp. A25]|nr:unnamed protein product [Amoebophrya sp. A25]|eukprot:GSA25T00006217001.1
MMARSRQPQRRVEDEQAAPGQGGGTVVGRCLPSRTSLETKGAREVREDDANEDEQTDDKLTSLGDAALPKGKRGRAYFSIPPSSSSSSSSTTDDEEQRARELRDEISLAIEERDRDVARLSSDLGAAREALGGRDEEITQLKRRLEDLEEQLYDDAGDAAALSNKNNRAAALFKGVAGAGSKGASRGKALDAAEDEERDPNSVAAGDGSVRSSALHEEGADADTAMDTVMQDASKREAHFIKLQADLHREERKLARQKLALEEEHRLADETTRSLEEIDAQLQTRESAVAAKEKDVETELQFLEAKRASQSPRAQGSSCTA